MKSWRSERGTTTSRSRLASSRRPRPTGLARSRLPAALMLCCSAHRCSLHLAPSHRASAPPGGAVAVLHSSRSTSTGPPSRSLGNLAPAPFTRRSTRSAHHHSHRTRRPLSRLRRPPRSPSAPPDLQPLEAAPVSAHFPRETARPRRPHSRPRLGPRYRASRASSEAPHALLAPGGHSLRARPGPSPPRPRARVLALAHVCVACVASVTAPLLAQGRARFPPSLAAACPVCRRPGLRPSSASSLPVKPSSEHKVEHRGA